MRKSIIIIGLVVILISALVWLVWNANQKSGQGIIIHGHKFEVEMADTSQKRELGLGERPSLCQECGMVFVFPEKGIRSFWMKGMRFPLDIIWFNSADGKIIYLAKNIPADSQEIFTSSDPTDRVLEINGGLADKYEIQIGDQVNQN